MFKLTLEKEAQADLTAMISAKGTSERCALQIVAFLQELKTNQALLSELLTRGFENDKFNVDKFVSFWDVGLDMWRLALFEFDFTRHKKWQMPYRILYGYDQQFLTFRVLGVLPREFNYEPNHELTKRICRTYDDLGMPKHRVSSPRSNGHNSTGKSNRRH